MRQVHLLLAAIGVAAFMAMQLPVAEADAIAPAAELPFARDYASAVWTGQHVYIFGGRTGGESETDQIVRYDPATKELRTMSAKLPRGLQGTGAVWTGQYAYVIGGRNCGEDPDPYFDCVVYSRIYRYDPAADTLTYTGASLPEGRYRMAVAWDGSGVWIGGSQTCVDTTDPAGEILRYDPVTNTVAMKRDVVYGGHYYVGAAGAWTGTEFAVVGGTHCTAPPPFWHAPYPENRMLFVDPTGTETREGWLERGRWDAGAAVAGDTLWLVGGGKWSSNMQQVVRVNLTTTVSTLSDVVLPHEGIEGAAAVWTGRHVVVIGGHTYGGTILRTIHHISVPSSAPLAVSAEAGPATGEMRLTWSPPANEGSAAPTSYRIERVDGETGALTVFISTSTSYVDTTVEGNVTYSYRVIALNEGGASPASAPALGKALSSVPRMPPAFAAAPGPGKGQIQLAWGTPTNDGGSPLTAFRVYRNGSPLQEIAPTARSFADSGLPDGTAHLYAVSAVSALGEGPRSPAATARTPLPACAVRDLRPWNIAGGVELRWEPPTCDGGMPITAIRIYETRQSVGVEQVAADVHPSGWYFRRDGLQPGENVTFRVAARTGYGDGVSTLALGRAIGPPSPPTGLKLLAGARLEWSASADHGGMGSIYEYRISRIEPDGTETYLGRTSGLSWFDRQSANVSVHYEVRASNYYFLSGAASIAGLTPPGPPHAPGIVALAGPGRGEMTITITPPANDGGSPLTGYEIRRTIPGYICGGVYVGTTPAPTYTERGFSDGQRVEYCVRALNAHGSGALSVPAADTTYYPPSAPESVAVTAGPEAGVLTVSWQPPRWGGKPDVSGYRVLRTGPTGGEVVAGEVGLVTTFRDAGLLGETSYSYRVVALAGPVPSAPSGSASGVTLPFAPVYELPTAPLALAATPGAGEGELRVEWSPPASRGNGSISTYRIERDGAHVATVPAIEAHHPFTFDAEGFQTLQDQPRAKIFWSGRQIRLESDRYDAQDELFVRPLGASWTASSGSWEASARWRPTATNADSQGWPLVLSATGITDPSAAPAIAATQWRFRDETPRVTLWYRDLAGVVRINQNFPVGAAGDYSVSFAFDHTTRTLTMRLLAANGAALGTASAVVPAGDAFRIEQIMIASEGSNGIGGSMSGYVDDITIRATRPAWLDTGREHGATFTYRVTAENQAGEGPASELASGTTLLWVPRAPQALVATPGAGGGEITLQWTAPTSAGSRPISGYVVQRYQGTAFVDVATVNGTSFVHTGLGNGTTVRYRVLAESEIGRSAPSAEASATTFRQSQAPMNIRALPGFEPGTVEVAWDAPFDTGGATILGFSVYRRDLVTGVDVHVARIGLETRYVDADRPVGDAYSYSVSAWTVVGEGRRGGGATYTIGTDPGV